jgi:hypothetical protein
MTVPLSSLLAHPAGDVQRASAADGTLLAHSEAYAYAAVIKSVPEGADRVQEYRFRLTWPGYRELFDGSEQLIGISVAPWHLRQVFGP